MEPFKTPKAPSDCVGHISEVQTSIALPTYLHVVYLLLKPFTKRLEALSDRKSDFCFTSLM